MNMFSSRLKPTRIVSLAEILLPGLPHELALLCFAKLPIDAVARCRAVSRSWASALSQYPVASRLPQALACLCVSRASRENSMAWLLFSQADLRCLAVPFFTISLENPERSHMYSSQTQVLTTGTNLLLVRSRLTFSGEPVDGVVSAHKEPGLLQVFDLWTMKWCREAVHVPLMHVDRWDFATVHVGEHVYVAGGGGDRKAAKSAERLNTRTGKWEVLPEMMKERTCPAGFSMGGRFYVVGGEFDPIWNTAGRTLSGEFYDPEKGVWELVQGMWPKEMWGFGGTPNVVVVKDEAYAISKRLEVMRWTTEGSWEKAGRLHKMFGFESGERWLIRLLSVGEDELWVVSFNKDQACRWLVFSCKPYLSNGELFWKHLPFTTRFSPWQGIFTSGGVYI